MGESLTLNVAELIPRRRENGGGRTRLFGIIFRVVLSLDLFDEVYAILFFV